MNQIYTFCYDDGGIRLRTFANDDAAIAEAKKLGNVYKIAVPFVRNVWRRR